MTKCKRSRGPGGSMGAGIAIGVAVGVAMDNIGAGIAIGVAIGVAMESKRRSKASDTGPTDEDSSDS